MTTSEGSGTRGFVPIQPIGERCSESRYILPGQSRWNLLTASTTIGRYQADESCDLQEESKLKSPDPTSGDARRSLSGGKIRDCRGDCIVVEFLEAISRHRYFFFTGTQRRNAFRLADSSFHLPRFFVSFKRLDHSCERLQKLTD